MSKPIEAIGIIKETRPDENRTPLIPEHIENIKSNYPNLNVVGQENTARIKLKNKLSKRLLPIQLIEGELKDEIIKYNDQEIGKVLIKNLLAMINY